MLDKSIPYFNIIMKCPDISKSHYTPLPPGYSFRFFEPGDEEYWAAIESSVGEFDSQGEALAYFYEYYMPHIDELKRRCIFAIDTHGMPVGTCTAWYDRKGDETINSLHWFAVHPKYQGIGIGKALVTKIMDIYKESGGAPAVYLHTQTWSYKAIGIYLNCGFCALRSGAFSDYRNDFEDAAAALAGVMRADSYKLFLDSAI